MTLDTIVVPPALTAALQTLNNNFANTERRRIEPRQLRDGTWILNADILTDTAAGRTSARYRAHLTGLVQRTITDADLPTVP